LVLNILQIPYEYKAVHLVKNGGENHSEEFHKINPAEKVPVLELFDSNENKKVFLNESNAIIEFLLENFKNENTNLLPEDPILKAKTRKLYNHIACNIQPIQNLPVLNKVAEYNVNKADWANFFINKGLESFEEMVKETKGKFCVGDNITLADIYLVPQIYNARRFNVDVSKFSNISEIENNLKDLDEFLKACPENQPDAEK